MLCFSIYTIFLWRIKLHRCYVAIFCHLLFPVSHLPKAKTILFWYSPSTASEQNSNLSKFWLQNNLSIPLLLLYKSYTAFSADILNMIWAPWWQVWMWLFQSALWASHFQYLNKVCISQCFLILVHHKKYNGNCGEGEESKSRKSYCPSSTIGSFLIMVKKCLISHVGTSGTK